MQEEEYAPGSPIELVQLDSNGKERRRKALGVGLSPVPINLAADDTLLVAARAGALSTIPVLRALNPSWDTAWEVALGVVPRMVTLGRDRQARVLGTNGWQHSVSLVQAAAPLLDTGWPLVGGGVQGAQRELGRN